MKFFSIIIPTLNAAPTLAATLESLLAQSFPNYEVLLQDGGSTDDTHSIATRYTARFRGRLRTVIEKDHGVYDAMNRALRRAEGRWCYFLGADDLLHDNEVLKTVAASIRSQPKCQIIYGNVIMRQSGNHYDGPFDAAKILRMNICHQAIFYRREVFETMGDFDLRYPIWADWDFNVRCFFSGQWEIHYFDWVAAHYNDLSGVSFQSNDPTLLEKLKKLSVENIPLKRRWTLRQTLRRKLENFLWSTVYRR